MHLLVSTSNLENWVIIDNKCEILNSALGTFIKAIAGRSYIALLVEQGFAMFLYVIFCNICGRLAVALASRLIQLTSNKSFKNAVIFC